MDTSFQIVVLLMVAVGISAPVQACDDLCFCSTSSTLSCNYRGLARPPEGYWPTITYLRLMGNEISVLYNMSFSGFPNVASIEMHSNNLTQINWEMFSQLQDLVNVRLNNNQIETLIPPSIGTRLYKFNQVSVEGNRITSLDPDFFQFAPNLTWFYANNNPLVVPEGQPILNSPMVEYLYMSNLTKVHLGPESLAGMPILEYVELANNGITDITGAFVTNYYLYSIKLDMNEITEVTAGTFPSKNYINYIYLDGNPLTRLDVAALNYAMAVESLLSINETPLACSCGFEALYWWGQLKGVSISAKCNGMEKCFFTKRTNDESGS